MKFFVLTKNLPFHERVRFSIRKGESFIVNYGNIFIDTPLCIYKLIVCTRSETFFFLTYAARKYL
jgi:hypothetical protein